MGGFFMKLAHRDGSKDRKHVKVTTSTEKMEEDEQDINNDQLQRVSTIRDRTSTLSKESGISMNEDPPTSTIQGEDNIATRLHFKRDLDRVSAEIGRISTISNESGIGLNEEPFTSSHADEDIMRKIHNLHVEFMQRKLRLKSGRTTFSPRENTITERISSVSKESCLSTEKRRTRRENADFQVIKDTKFLPRYTYHRALLDWFIEGIPKHPIFQACHFTDCQILIGGKINDEDMLALFGEKTSNEHVLISELHSG